MSGFVLIVALFLLVNVVVGLARVWLGPTAPDRMLATLLFGTTGTAILLLLAEGMSIPAVRDVATVLALLAAISTVVFVRCWPGAPEGKGGLDEHS
jgi:multicomponent Na+:H+ antiporter subunit F